MLFSRLGVYIPLPGVDVGAFAASIKSEGLLGYIDTLSGGSISRVGIFSLGENEACQSPYDLHAARFLHEGLSDVIIRMLHASAAATCSRLRPAVRVAGIVP